MELFEAIRREYQFGVGTIKGVARKFGIHRRMVREALADAVPKARRRVERTRPKLEPAIPFIDTILENDLKEPRKQRHTANRSTKLDTLAAFLKTVGEPQGLPSGSLRSLIQKGCVRVISLMSPSRNSPRLAKKSHLARMCRCSPRFNCNWTPRLRSSSCI